MLVARAELVITTNQVGTDSVKLGQVKSCQVRWGHSKRERTIRDLSIRDS